MLRKRINLFINILSVNEKLLHLTYDNINEELEELQHSILWHRVPCITTMENCIHHTRMHYTRSLTAPVVSIALYRKMQSFGVTLKFDPHFVFNPFTAVYNARNMPGENTAILMFLWCYI